MKWLGCIIDSIDMSLRKLLEIVKDREAWGAAVQGSKELDRTEQQRYYKCMHIQLCPTLTPWTVACGLLCPWDFPDRNTGVGFHSLLQGIFPTQGSNLHLLFPALAGGFFYH